MTDLRCRVGSLQLPNPVMTASGTAGHGAEFHSFFDLADLGAHVVKSIAAFEWEGNPAPRVHPAGAGHPPTLDDLDSLILSAEHNDASRNS